MLYLFSLLFFLLHFPFHLHFEEHLRRLDLRFLGSGDHGGPSRPPGEWIIYFRSFLCFNLRLKESPNKSCKVKSHYKKAYQISACFLSEDTPKEKVPTKRDAEKYQLAFSCEPQTHLFSAISKHQLVCFPLTVILSPPHFILPAAEGRRLG